MGRQRQRERFDQVTVDTEPDTQPVVERLDVDVRAAVTKGLADDLADELDDRCLIVEVHLGEASAAMRCSSSASNAGTMWSMSAVER